MILKPFQMNAKLKYYLALTHRATFTNKQNTDYYTQLYGYNGEKNFYHRIKKLDQIVFLHDLTLTSKYKGQAKYDFIIIHSGRVVHIDVKNFKGTYRQVDDNFISNYKKIKNPMGQLSVAHDILENTLLEMTHTVQSKILFINENFCFRGNTDIDQWVFLSELDQYLEQFKSLNHLYDIDLEIGRYLLSQHDDSENQFPPITVPFDNVMSGMKCPKCLNFVNHRKQKLDFNCQCGFHCKNEMLIKHNIDELMILFGQPVTIQQVYSWCQTVPLSTIKRVLTKYYKKIGQNRGSKYYFK